MALDPRIAMGVQPIQIEPQANALMRALQITNAMQQNRLAAMQGQDMAEQRRMQREQMQNALMQQQQRRQFLGQFNPLAGPARPMDPQALFASGLFSAEEADKVGKLGEEKLHNLGPGGRLVTGSGQVRAEAPFKPAEPNINDLIVMGPDGKPMVNQALLDAKKQIAASAPGVSVSYGSPIPAMNPATGEAEFVRPDNKGGMNFTGVRPPPQNRDTKLPAELQRMQIAGDAMVKLMDDYEAMLRKHNPRDPLTQMNPTVRADMQALKRNIELQFKELQALGALAGPDVEIMRQSLSDPFSWQGAYFGRDGLLAQVRRGRQLVKTRTDAVMSSQGRPAKPDAAASEAADPFGFRGK